MKREQIACRVSEMDDDASFSLLPFEVKKELPKAYTPAKEMHKASPLTIVADAAEKDLIGYKAVVPMLLCHNDCENFCCPDRLMPSLQCIYARLFGMLRLPRLL